MFSLLILLILLGVSMVGDVVVFRVPSTEDLPDEPSVLGSNRVVSLRSHQRPRLGAFSKWNAHILLSGLSEPRVPSLDKEDLNKDGFNHLHGKLLRPWHFQICPILPIWFLLDVFGSWTLLKTAGSLPCGPAAPRIFVDEPEEFKALWANPLLCAERGLCFTEAPGNGVSWWRYIPSGKHTKSYGKLPLMVYLSIKNGHVQWLC